MKARTPSACPHRRLSETADENLAVCNVLREASGVTDEGLCLVGIDTCNACCQCLRDPRSVNSVVASLLYSLASKVVAVGGHPQCSVQKARTLQSRATDQLSLVMSKLPREQFPLTVPSMQAKSTSSRASAVRTNGKDSSSSLVWATALLTAPRDVPQIEQTLDSLHRAGLSDIHIFAEPDSWIPERYQHLSITRRMTRLGNLLNFYSCLSTLLSEHPTADVFAVFQDDIRAAHGLRGWCDEQFWPLDCGIVSLFTPQLHAARTVGWQLHSPGFQRLCGAQSLIFRRDLLERFLSDPRVLQCLTLRENGSDAALGGWLGREGLSIAYHTPSPIDHVGMVSSLYRTGPDRRNLGQAVQSVSQIENWIFPSVQTGIIGLVGYDTPTGLGTINRELAEHLQINRWMKLSPRTLRPITAHEPDHGQVVRALPQAADLQRWVSDLDWLLFVERPLIPELPRLAAHQGVGIACIPMWEWIQPHDHWLLFVDVMICPTAHTFELMQDWKTRYGFGWRSVYVPWPIDYHRFEFRLRRVCQEFLFVNGWGGCATWRPYGSPTPYRRKGLELVLAAAALAPDLKFVVQSQSPLPSGLPPNVRVAATPSDHRRLFEDGDVCVQPSHYEGLGLQLLECQAAGLPLVTTDARPMNEAHPWRTIPTCGREVIQVGSGYISSALLRPQDLVNTLRPLVGIDITVASRQARGDIETHRRWNSAADIIHSELAKR